MLPGPYVKPGRTGLENAGQDPVTLEGRTVHQDAPLPERGALGQQLNRGAPPGDRSRREEKGLWERVQRMPQR